MLHVSVFGAALRTYNAESPVAARLLTRALLNAGHKAVLIEQPGSTRALIVEPEGVVRRSGSGWAVRPTDPQVLREFDVVRRLGICNMVSRAQVRDVAEDLDLSYLLVVASDKRAYPELLVAYKRQIGES